MNFYTRGFKSVIIFGASNSAELKDKADRHLLASKELMINDRIIQIGFNMSIDDPVTIEIPYDSFHKMIKINHVLQNSLGRNE